MKYRWHPGKADPRARNVAAIKQTRRAGAMVTTRLDSDGDVDLVPWLRSIGAGGWPFNDRLEALGIIKKRAANDVWRAAIKVLR